MYLVNAVTHIKCIYTRGALLMVSFTIYLKSVSTTAYLSCLNYKSITYQHVH